ncbi:hypothetical protein M2436_000114 [Streptomyces sp. HB372]|nr:hypothetical protein [Streptomyces sp. HB372]
MGSPPSCELKLVTKQAVVRQSTTGAPEGVKVSVSFSVTLKSAVRADLTDVRRVAEDAGVGGAGKGDGLRQIHAAPGLVALAADGDLVLGAQLADLADRQRGDADAAADGDGVQRRAGRVHGPALVGEDGRALFGERGRDARPVENGSVEGVGGRRERGERHAGRGHRGLAGGDVGRHVHVERALAVLEDDTRVGERDGGYPVTRDRVGDRAAEAHVGGPPGRVHRAVLDGVVDPSGRIRARAAGHVHRAAHAGDVADPGVLEAPGGPAGHQDRGGCRRRAAGLGPCGGVDAGGGGGGNGEDAGAHGYDGQGGECGQAAAAGHGHALHVSFGRGARRTSGRSRSREANERRGDTGFSACGDPKTTHRILGEAYLIVTMGVCARRR